MTKRQPALNAPPVILVVLGLFVAAHLYRSALSPADELTFLVRFAFIPLRYASTGAEKLVFPDGLAGDIWTFVSYMFVHADWGHLMINGFWLLAFGSLVARRLGLDRFLLLSLLCGIAGALAHLAFHWGDAVPTIGASGAISGLMAAAARFIFSAPEGLRAAIRFGANVALLPRLSLRRLVRNRQAMFFLGIWLGINLLFGVGAFQIAGMSGGIAWQAHIGGFLAGLLLFDWFDRYGVIA
jgi:membrane associated rhomboid family serine protease